MSRIKNAVIESAKIEIERGIVTACINLNYGGSGQGFGGYALYLPKKSGNDYTGQFIYKTLKAVGVQSWDHLQGKTVRVDSDNGKVYGIGHILREMWFYPDKDLKNEEE